MRNLNHGLGVSVLALGLACCGGSSSSGGAGGSVQASPGCTTPAPSRSAAQPPIAVFALGTHTVGDTVSFALPPGAASFSIVEQVVSAPATASFTEGTLANSAAPLRIVDPSGNVVFDQTQSQPDPTQALLFFVPNSPGAGTVTLPDSTSGLALVASGLPSGSWSAVVSDLAHLCTLAIDCAPGGGSATSTYDVQVIVKPGAGDGNIPASGTLDVTFNLTPPLTARDAATDPDVQRLVSSLGLLLSRAQLALGTVRFVDVPAGAASLTTSGLNLDDGTACGDLAQLFASAPPGRQANVFLVESLVASSTTPGAQIVGVDGTIPGPATISPSLQSGVAVSSADLHGGRSQCAGALALDCGSDPAHPTCCGADVTAYVAAHEIGHFLGLYHVTDQQGVRFDPLAETPTFPCRTCAPDPSRCADAPSPPSTPHTMSVGECEASAQCAGGDNLMFWLRSNGSLGTLVPEQASVMRANPAVY